MKVVKILLIAAAILLAAFAIAPKIVGAQVQPTTLELAEVCQPLYSDHVELHWVVKNPPAKIEDEGTVAYLYGEEFRVVDYEHPFDNKFFYPDWRYDPDAQEIEISGGQVTLTHQGGQRLTVIFTHPGTYAVTRCSVELANSLGICQRDENNDLYIQFYWETEGEVSQYHIYRSRNGDDLGEELPGQPIVYEPGYYLRDTSIEPGTMYFYRVQAVGPDGISRIFSPIVAGPCEEASAVILSSLNAEAAGTQWYTPIMGWLIIGLLIVLAILTWGGFLFDRPQNR
ncbi:MAG: hypothetical protein ACEQSA_00295 [Weeksellaceae bacterium]